MDERADMMNSVGERKRERIEAALEVVNNISRYRDREQEEKIDEKVSAGGGSLSVISEIVLNITLQPWVKKKKHLVNDRSFYH